MLHAVNGTELYIESVGSGPPLLMLHGGLGLDHTYFRPSFDQLAENHTVVYYDHRGNGRSAPLEAGGPELTFDDLVADAIGVLDVLGHDRAVVIGHSYGGFVAQMVAVDHADRLSGLVLLDTVPAFDYAPEPPGTEEQLAAFGQLFAGPAADDDTWAELWSTVWPMYFHRWDADEAARIHAGTRYRAAGWNAAAGLLATFNTIDALPGLPTPTLCVAGANDFITPPAPGAVRLAELLPAGELAIFDQSGHYPFIEEEPAFFARLKQFLADRA